jgi:hypothetical protein
MRLSNDVRFTKLVRKELESYIHAISRTSILDKLHRGPLTASGDNYATKALQNCESTVILIFCIVLYHKRSDKAATHRKQ